MIKKLIEALNRLSPLTWSLSAVDSNLREKKTGGMFSSFSEEEEEEEQISKVTQQEVEELQTDSPGNLQQKVRKAWRPSVEKPNICTLYLQFNTCKMNILKTKGMWFLSQNNVSDCS